MYPPLKTLQCFSFALDAVQTCYQLTGPFTVWTTLTSLISFLATVILGFSHIDSFAILSTNLTASPICTSIPPLSCAWQILGPTSLPSPPLVTLQCSAQERSPPRSSLWPIPAPRALWTADLLLILYVGSTCLFVSILHQNKLPQGGDCFWFIQCHTLL